MVEAMESTEDALERLLPTVSAQAHLLTVLSPTEGLRAFVWIFVLHEETALADAMAVDYEEMAALMARYPDHVAPELQHAWQAGALLLKP